MRRFPRFPLTRAITGHLAGRRQPLGVVVLALLLAAAAACAEDEPPPPPPGAPPGSAGQPLPSPSPQPSPPQRPDAGLVDAGALEPDGGPEGCGGTGQLCCPGDPSCDGAFTHCDPELATCVACGSGGQSCCNQGPPCRSPLSCSGGICAP
ncbi:MAG TPA: hypothetical protein VKZ63_18980 [Kofleriaceae bacterium]|nr:hypothetical protein [Kofleriaceae bacterium]